MVSNTPIAGRGESAVQLRARAGRAVLLGVEGREELGPEDLELPATLTDALHEWAGVAERVGRGERTDDAAAHMVSRRGMQLAARLAAETASEIDYLDPVTGHRERVAGRPSGRRASGARGASGTRRASGHRVEPGGGTRTAPTPWASGLTVSAILAAIVTVSLVVVSIGLAEVNVVLAVAVNVAVAAGFAPSIWMGRNIEVWRWVALGTAAGMGLAWFALLLSLLGG